MAWWWLLRITAPDEWDHAMAKADATRAPFDPKAIRASDATAEEVIE